MGESVYCVLVPQLVDGGDDVRRVDSVWTDADDARARLETLTVSGADSMATVTEHVLNNPHGESYIDSEVVISTEDERADDRSSSGESGLDAYRGDDLSDDDDYTEECDGCDHVFVEPTPDEVVDHLLNEHRREYPIHRVSEPGDIEESVTFDFDLPPEQAELVHERIWGDADEQTDNDAE